MYQGFDEYMNIVLDDAVEINTKNSNRKSIGLLTLNHALFQKFDISIILTGRILLKGDCITLIQKANPDAPEEQSY